MASFSSCAGKVTSISDVASTRKPAAATRKPAAATRKPASTRKPAAATRKPAATKKAGGNIEKAVVVRGGNWEWMPGANTYVKWWKSSFVEKGWLWTRHSASKGNGNDTYVEVWKATPA